MEGRHTRRFSLLHNIAIGCVDGCDARNLRYGNNLPINFNHLTRVCQFYGFIGAAVSLQSVLGSYGSFNSSPLSKRPDLNIGVRIKLINIVPKDISGSD